MIQICSPNRKVIRVIPNGNEFFNHISAGELLADHPEFDETNTHWSFVVFPAQRVPDLYLKMKKEFLTPSIRQAFQKELGLIEICQGNYANPTWIPMISDLDIGALKKDWYLAYCTKHGYTLTENRNANGSPDTTKVGAKGEDVR